MARLNRLLIQTDTEFMGTCCYLQLDPDDGSVTMVSAGHPPPVLIGATGRSKLVDLEANLPLGVEERTVFDEVAIELPPGATLVLYTDGLVESRSLSLDDGLARVTGTPQSKAREDLESLAEYFLLQAPRDQTDDLTLLLLRNSRAQT
jgi:serine phosphatase RsbU (regulator of sigma subunit)